MGKEEGAIGIDGELWVQAVSRRPRTKLSQVLSWCLTNRKAMGLYLNAAKRLNINIVRILLLLLAPLTHGQRRYQDD